MAQAQTITWDASPSGGTPNATALELIQDTATPTPSGQYIGLRFSSSTPLTNVYVQATVAGAGFSLDATEAATRFVGNLTSAAQTSYWYINQPPSGNGRFQLRLYLGNPAAGGTLRATSPLYTLTNSDVDQPASANKINSVVVNGGNPIQLGQSFNVVVNYTVNSAGPNLIVQPAALASFDPFNLRLGATKVELCSDTACSTVTSTLNNQLYFTNVGGNVNGVRATYTFQTVGTVSVALSPIVVARSGQYKYNPDFASPTVNTTVPAPVNRVKIAKSVNIIQSDVGTTVTYTLTASNSGSATVSLDELEDTLPSSPANASYVVGSSRLNGAAFANPVISGQVLSWRASGNQFTVPAGGSFALSFQATLPGTNGTYTNRAIGRINGNVIGSTETLNSAPATASTRVGQPVSVTGSLFNDLDRNGARDTGEDAFTTGSATVTLTNTSTNQTLTTTTATGSYAFSDVPAGTYNVTVSVPGYQVTTPARTVTVGTSNVSVADIGLAQNPTSQPCSVVYAGGFGTSTSAATAPYSIYPVDTSTGVAGTALFAVPYQTAAFARDPVTGRFYYIENATGTTSARVGYYDPATGAVPTSATTTITKSGGDSGNFTRFAFNSAGVGYASMGSNNAIYRLDLSNGGNTVTVTRLGVIQGLPSNTSGDFAFSASGILRLLTNGVLYRIELSNLTADQVLNTGNNTINGAAFDATGNFYVGNTTTLFRVNLGTGEFTQIGTGLGSTVLSADLGSCAYPTFTTIVSASKTVAPTGSVTPGTILTYTVTVTNSGNALATKTTFTDAVPANTTYVAGSTTLNGTAVADVNGATPYASGGFIQSPGATYAEGSVGTSAPAVVRFQVRVNDPVPTGTVQVSNQGTVTYSRGPTGGVPTDGDAAAAGTQPTVSPLSLPDLTVAKAAVGSFVRGSSASYTLTVNNVGSAPTSGTITVTDALPTGLSYTAATGTGWACSFEAATQTVTCTRTTAIPAGTSAPPLTLNVTVGQTAPASVVNTATVSGGGESNTANNSGSATTPVTSRADLGVVKIKTAPSGDLVPGQTVTYRLVVSNGGPSNVTGFNVSDAVPAAFTGVTWTCTAAGVGDCDTLAAGTGGSGSGNAVTLSNAQLNAGGGNTLTITLNGTLSANATGSVTNTATVAAPSGVTDPAAGNNTSSVTTPVQATADLALVETASSSSPQPGEQVTYTFRVTNSGPSATTNVTVSDALPAGLTLIRTNGCAQDPNGVPSCALGSVAAGAETTFTLVATAQGNLGATVTNTASVSATETDPAPQNNTATATVTLSGMTLSKTVCNVTASGCDAENEYVEMVEAAPEDVLEYRITYLRRGPPVFDVVLTDPVPENNVLTTFPNGAKVVVLCPDASVQNLGQGNPLVVSFNLADVCALGVAPRPEGGSAEALSDGDTGNFRFRVVIP